MKKSLYVLVGVAALLLGAAGSFLPVLPTTPFLLLALFCFARGSKRLNDWFCGTRLYKRYLSEYARTKSMTLCQKLAIGLLAGGMMAISFALIDNTVARVLLAAGFMVHNYVFIFRIKTRERGQNNSIPEKAEPSLREAKGEIE